VRSHGGVVVLAATTAVAAVVVPIPVVVVAVTIAEVAAVVLAGRARRRQGRRQSSGRRFVGVERRRSSSWTGGVQVDFLHHGIRLDVEVGDDGVNVRRRSGRGLRGRGRRGSGDQLLDGGLLFEINGGGLLLIKELTGGQDATTRGGGLVLGSFGSGDQGVEPLLGDLDVGGQKGDDGMKTEEEEVEATRASSHCLRASASVAERATMSDDITTGGEEEA
jgi:hypothetical protein